MATQNSMQIIAELRRSSSAASISDAATTSVEEIVISKENVANNLLQQIAAKTRLKKTTEKLEKKLRDDIDMKESLQVTTAFNRRITHSCTFAFANEYNARFYSKILITEVSF